jgi:WD40 repeat protein
VPTQLLQVKPSPQLRQTRQAIKDAVLDARFSPDGKTLVSTGPLGEVILWDVDGLKKRFELPAEGHVYGVSFTHDSKRLLLPSYQPVDADGKPLQRPYSAGAVKGLHGGVRVCDVGSGKLLAWLRREPQRGVFRVSVTADGNTAVLQEVARDSKDKQTLCTSLWDLTTRKPRAELPGNEAMYAVSPDGKTLVRRGEKGAALWDIDSARPRATLTKTGEYLGRCVYSADGRTLVGIVSGTDGASVALWNVASGERLKQLTAGVQESVHSLALSPDGNWLAMGSGSPSRTVEPADVQVWNVKTGKQVLALRGHINSVTAVDFHPDGKLLASSGSDGTIRLWDLSTLAP